MLPFSVLLYQNDEIIKLRYWCFPGKFKNILETAFLKTNSEQLLLYWLLFKYR